MMGLAQPLHVIAACAMLAAAATTAQAHWHPNGVPVCTAAHSQSNPVIVPDSSGGSIVAWQDLRDNTTKQRVRGTDGALLGGSSRAPARVPDGVYFLRV